MTFDELGLTAPLLRAVRDKGYSEPSPIQAQAIPAVLSGRDVMAAAQTGTGKTAGFVLPILQLLSASPRAHPRRLRALIITPTRELAAQVADSVTSYGKHLSLKSLVVFGGVKAQPQIKALRKGVDILIATPGRLLDLYQQGEVRCTEIEILVLDEADRMLDMGFIDELRQILELLPAKRQNLLFSATFARQIRQLTRTILHQAVVLEVSAPNATAELVEQWVYPVDKRHKSALLQQLVKEHEWQQVLVFCRTKQGADKLSLQLAKAGINAVAIHGDRSQVDRSKALAGFKAGKIRVLVATDIAARGLDIAQLPQVVNFELPTAPEHYIHRIGRTGRAGAAGKAYSLVSADEIKQLNAIEHLIQRHIAREYVGGFEPGHELPASAPMRKPQLHGKARLQRTTALEAGDSVQGSEGSDGQGSPSAPGKRRSANRARPALGGNTR